MSADLIEQITTALAQFRSDIRLYAFTIGDEHADLGSGGLLVEAFAADDEVQAISGRDVIVVWTNARIAAEPLLGQQANCRANRAQRVEHGVVQGKAAAGKGADAATAVTAGVE